MAYLNLTSSDENNSCFKFIGANNVNNNGGLISETTSLISNNTSLIFDSEESGLDTCSFYSGPSDSTIVAFGESYESTGSVAYGESSETCGSIAYASGSESCGSIASSSSSSSGSFCSYSC